MKSICRIGVFFLLLTAHAAQGEDHSEAYKKCLETLKGADATIARLFGSSEEEVLQNGAIARIWRLLNQDIYREFLSLRTELEKTCEQIRKNNI